MTFYPDLSDCRYFFDTDSAANKGRQVKAISWLEDSLPGPPGVPEDLEAAVDGLVRIWLAGVDPWGTSMGRQGCGLCGMPLNKAPATELIHKGRRLELGAGFITVPGDGVLYVAPSLIIHYIVAHRYRPPSLFIEAIKRCPRPKSRAYRRALQRNGFPGPLERRLTQPAQWQWWLADRWKHPQTAVGRVVRRFLVGF